MTDSRRPLPKPSDDRPSPMPKPSGGHEVVRTLAAVVAAAALVFIGIQEQQQTYYECRQALPKVNCT